MSGLIVVVALLGGLIPSSGARAERDRPENMPHRVDAVGPEGTHSANAGQLVDSDETTSQEPAMQQEDTDSVEVPDEDRDDADNDPGRQLTETEEPQRVAEGGLQEAPDELANLENKPVRVETTGGGGFQGTMHSWTEDRIEIVTSDGEIIQIHRPDIKSLTRLEGDRGGRQYFQDSASNRLIVAPTAFPMEPGEFHVSDQEIVVVTTSYGLTSNVSLWGGISPMGALASGRYTSSLSDSIAVSAGSFVGVSWVTDSVSGLLMPYTVASWGSRNTNISVGAGVAFEFGTESRMHALGAVGMVGGKIVLTSSTALVSENWIIWGERTKESHDPLTGAVSRRTAWDSLPVATVEGLVFRIAGKVLSGDIGAILPMQVHESGLRGLGDGPIIPIPWVAMTYRID